MVQQTVPSPPLSNRLALLLEERAEAAGRVPSLIAPLAWVGLAAGWLTGTTLRGPLLWAATEGVEHRAALTALAIGALVGAFCSTACRRTVERPDQGRVWRELATFAVVLGAGVAAGAVVGMTELRSSAMLEGVAVGAVAGIPSYLVCRLVMAVAERAARARLGSLVAEADRRRVWATLAAAIAVLTVPALLEWDARHPYGRPYPWVALGLVAFANALLAAVVVADLRALRQLARLEPELSGLEPLSALPGDHHPGSRLDLGLGGVLLARAQPGADYRRAPRYGRLVVGNPRLAQAALVGALLTGALRLGLGLLILGTHLTAWHIAAETL